MNAIRSKTFVLFAWFVLSTTSFGQSPDWQTIQAAGAPTARHEAAFVGYKGKGYLIGGRRINPVDVFDPATSTWTEKSPTPLELHHFQAVVVGDAIYLIGAMTGGWPNETPLEKIVVYYPEKDEFAFVHSIPETRRRGGAGAVLHDGKIYVVGGITNGHMDGYQPWLDAYDPATGDWTALADAPHARDHFQAVVADGKLFALAGRTTSQRTDQGFDLTVKPLDVYDFESGKWLDEHEFPDLPTLRAGNMAAVVGDQILVGGGESAGQKAAHNEVEALDLKTKTWRSLPALQRGRHGSGFAILDEAIYTASGSGNRGGGPELTSIERLDIATTASSSITSNGPAAEPKPIHLWHTKTLSFSGPQTSETATPNPFTDYRLLVTFTNGDAKYTIRGFYAADGDASESSAESGNVWQVRFSPDRVGTWTYKAELRRGTDIAISDNVAEGDIVEIQNSRGQFDVTLAAKKDTLDFRQRGRLVAEGSYLRFGKGGKHWLKGGSDSPENLLAFADFDGTWRMAVEASDGEATAADTLHEYAAHLGDWRERDPAWQNGKGKGLIGGINYLSAVGMNAMYFLTMNIGGDGKDVWPYRTPDDFTRFDCSKLDQWEIVFEHMQRRGILLHVVTQETENERMLDDGDTGRLRKIYYRELIARFAHHPALVWNLGEENGPADFSPDGQTAEQQKAMASYLKSSDPYAHPVVIHTHSTPAGKDEVIEDLLGHAPLDGLSFQVDKPSAVHSEVIRWHEKAKRAGRPWLIGMDEIGKWDTGVVPDSVDPTHDNIRRQVLWGSLMAGACGVEWYFGAKQPHNDLTSEDWRQRDAMWRQTKVAVDFFENHLPYWEMSPVEGVVELEGSYCFAKPSTVCCIYLVGDSLQGEQELEMDLSSMEGQFQVQWFKPVIGGELQVGSHPSVQANKDCNVGKPPGPWSRDWVLLLNRQQ